MATEFNTQAFFTTVVTRWAATGFERAVVDDSCRYRTDDGKRCVIGHGIPDEVYRPEFEGNDVAGLLVEMTDEEKEATFGTADLTPHDLRFLSALQEVHDGGDDGDIRQILEVFADRRGLRLPTL